MKLLRLLLVLSSCISLFALVSCSAAENLREFSLPSLSERMKEKGWIYLETLGQPGKSETEFYLESLTARTISAYSVTKRVREKKVYQQTDSLYAVITHQKPDGDTFSVVFKKSKS